MTTSPPVGRREDQHLEFKDAATLRDPHLIGREVVAMLNADGGEVWIGVPEEDGVAQAAQDVPAPASSADRLREHLLDTIAPRPGAREVSIEVVTHAAGQCLRIHIEPVTQSQPYAQLRKGGQFFWRRIEALIRPMTLAEVSARLRGTPAQPDPIAEMQRVLSQRGFRGLWIAIVPGHEIKLATDRARIEGLVREPTDVRYPGWNLASSWSEVEPLQGDRGGWLVRQGEAIHSRILRHGVFELTATGTALEHGQHDVVDPRALIALTQSFLRLAGRLTLELPAEDTLNLSIGLFGVDQLELRPFSHDTHGYQREYPGHPHRRYTLSRDLLLSTPLEFTVSDLIERPDACAYRLLVRLYQAYGYEMHELPRELDAANGVIRL